MRAQVNQLAGELPRYEATLREKIQGLRGVMAGTGTLERASEVLQGLRKEIERSENAPALDDTDAASTSGTQVTCWPCYVHARYRTTFGTHSW